MYKPVREGEERSTIGHNQNWGGIKLSQVFYTI
jgi:hypothetical protein